MTKDELKNLKEAAETVAIITAAQCKAFEERGFSREEAVFLASQVTCEQMKMAAINNSMDSKVPIYTGFGKH